MSSVQQTSDQTETKTNKITSIRKHLSVEDIFWSITYEVKDEVCFTFTLYEDGKLIKNEHHKRYHREDDEMKLVKEWDVDQIYDHKVVDIKSYSQGVEILYQGNKIYYADNLFRTGPSSYTHDPITGDCIIL